jgi:osmotically-inducible protein OsmY
LPNPATQAASGSGTAMQDSAITPADLALLGQLQQTVVARVPNLGSWGPVHFQVQNGVVTILGAVPTAAQQQQIESSVQQTPGVVAVMNKMTMAGSQPAGAAVSQDQVLSLRVRRAIVPQIQVAGNPVPVDFHAQQGVVTVVGTVSSIEQKRQIAALVQQVPGVVQVQDRMIVAGTAGANAAGALGTAGTSTASAPAGAQLGTANSGNPAIQKSGTANANLTPTGRTNSTALPRGLSNRTDLPPGLDRRIEMPPALAPRTNSFQ